MIQLLSVNGAKQEMAREIHEIGDGMKSQTKAAQGPRSLIVTQRPAHPPALPHSGVTASGNQVHENPHLHASPASPCEEMFRWEDDGWQVVASYVAVTSLLWLACGPVQPLPTLERRRCASPSLICVMVTRRSEAPLSERQLANLSLI
jgi:hypothetical protein